MSMKKDTEFYVVETNGDWSDPFSTYKEAYDYAVFQVTATYSPEIWKRERVAVMDQEVCVTKAK
jgi:hypothetical protein